MKQIFAFEQIEDYAKYQERIKRFTEKLVEYQNILQKDYELRELPRGIVWTTSELATTTFSSIPIPAYTNKDLIYFTPDLVAWRQLFIQQLEGRDYPEIKAFYENLPEIHIFTILGHELTHHLDLFPDEFDEERTDSIWFEEGMCQYLPRKYILSDEQFAEFTHIETELVHHFKDKYGNHTLDQFGQGSYAGSLTSIMYDYWRSFLAVKYLVEVQFNDDVYQVFKEYHRWIEFKEEKSLMEHFGITSII
ncbi:collagenase [Ornithinibacillus scapharcae]|uniref:collagenase n=1 Tax=Ornithinibacillus scapharcae TaxID=1147159 RepID=UPI000225BCE9|nr:collagenase [Ornithinibacillus scapharcae]